VNNKIEIKFIYTFISTLPSKKKLTRMNSKVVENMLLAFDDIKQEIIEKLAKKYGFDKNEALAYLEEPNEKITIENVHNHITYDYEEYEYYVEKDRAELKVTWDHENEEIDEIMDGDFSGNLSYYGRKNLMYIEEVKKRANWKKGEKLAITSKQNCDGCFYLFWNVDKTEDYERDLVIEPNGYIVVRHFNHYVFDGKPFFIRVDSVYNDIVCDNNN